MRIGLLIYGGLDTLSGGYLYDRKLVELLRRQGDQLHVFSLPWRSYPRHLLDNLSPSLPARLAGIPVDVWLQDELNHPSLFWTNRRLPRTCPLVAIVHHLRSSEAHPAWGPYFGSWVNPLYRLVERSYLRSVDGFIFNSETTRARVEDLAGFVRSSDRPGRPGVVAYPAGDRWPDLPDEAEIAIRADQPGPLRLLTLGSLIPRKGLHILLQALESLPPDTWELAVVGRQDADPRYARRLRRMAVRPDLAGRVSFYGALDDARLADTLRRSHLLVVPSSYEGFGIAYLEGMAFGLPAIASAQGGAVEIVTHGQDGFLVEPGDWRSLAACLQELAADRPRLARLSLAARSRFASHPTWEQTGLRIRDYLLSMLKA